MLQQLRVPIGMVTRTGVGCQLEEEESDDCDVAAPRGFRDTQLQHAASSILGGRSSSGSQLSISISTASMHYADAAGDTQLSTDLHGSDAVTWLNGHASTPYRAYTGDLKSRLIAERQAESM